MNGRAPSGFLARAGSARRFFRDLGPGLITGAADDDPSGIATYSSAGASFGFGLLWAALFTLPLMSAVQLMCARIGLVSRRGLASVLRRNRLEAVAFPVHGLPQLLRDFLHASIRARLESISRRSV